MVVTNFSNYVVFCRWVNSAGKKLRTIGIYVCGLAERKFQSYLLNRRILSFVQCQFT